MTGKSRHVQPVGVNVKKHPQSNAHYLPKH
jgi:hypothetical protein